LAPADHGILPAGLVERPVGEFLTCSIQSGSHGNCIYVEADGVRLLIDAGVSARKMRLALEAIGRSPYEIDALLVTHEHIDHTTSLGIFQRKFGMPVYTTARTHAVLLRRGLTHVEPEDCGSKIEDQRSKIAVSYAQGTLFDPPADGVRVNRIPRDLERRRGQQPGGGGVVHFRAGETFSIGPVRIHSVRTPHDAVDGVVFIIEASGRRLGVFTDLGHPFRQLGELLEAVDAAYLESNYDAIMLRDGRYPPQLKQRIAGPAGHLSNDESAGVLWKSLHSRMKWVALAHLSQENNTPELALDTHRRRVGAMAPLTLAPRDRASPLLAV
jgi:phosphoribosyl 1,2-cyclic phosphodiesterase